MGRAATSSLRRRVTRGLARAARKKPDALTSAVLTTPVFVTYHLGILLIDKRNGVDWITDLGLRLVHSSIAAYVALTLLLASGLSLAAFILRERGKLRAVTFGPIVAESALWSCGMLLTLGWTVARFGKSLATVDPGALDPLEKIVMAAGAGFHEELVFRVALFSGGAALLQRGFGLRGASAWLIAASFSAVLFGLAHHLGAAAPPVTLAALAFRTLAGLYLALVYAARGFAVAVYTHALYDAIVFFILS